MENDFNSLPEQDPQVQPEASVQQAPGFSPAPDLPAWEAASKDWPEAAPVAEPAQAEPAAVQEPAASKRKEKKAKKEKRAGGFWKTAVCAVLVLTLVGGACFLTAMWVNSRWEDRAAAMESDFSGKLSQLEEQIRDAADYSSGISVSGSPNVSPEGGLTPAQVYAANVQSVVLIRNEYTTTSFGQTSQAVATGSGFIISEDGFVVTNNHVVAGDGTLTVITADGKEHKAVLVGSDGTNDVALLKAEATDLDPVTLGSSSALIVGDQVVAIGNPLGELTSTLTVGYVSAMERDVTTEGFAINMLQTDAAINSGNSGGPLFNMKGEVIGITTAKYSGTSSGGATIEGVGFAIPIDDVMSVIHDLATYGYITGAYLGVSVSDMDPSAAAYYGIPMGAYVQEVPESYAAHRAGVQVKDIIVSLGEHEIETVNDLTKALRSFKAGDETVITVYRGGERLELPITLDEKPEQTTEMPEGDFDAWFEYFSKEYGDRFQKPGEEGSGED